MSNTWTLARKSQVCSEPKDWSAS